MALLELDGIAVSFGGIKVLSQVSFALEPGRVTGLIGPNGAGKTTVMNVISGLVRPSAGSVRFDGADITGQAPHRISQRGIKRTFQTSLLTPGLSVVENVMCGLDAQAGYGQVAAALQSPRVAAAERSLRDQARAALDAVGMSAFAERRGHELSFGQQRMVELARVLVSRPKLILLDEPAVGLSPQRLGDLSRQTREIARQYGVAILLIEHVIQLVMEVCERVIVMNAGQVLADGAPEAVTGDPRVIESYLGRGYYHA